MMNLLKLCPFFMPPKRREWKSPITFTQVLGSPFGQLQEDTLLDPPNKTAGLPGMGSIGRWWRLQGIELGQKYLDGGSVLVTFLFLVDSQVLVL